jgi:hypothetical protein
MAQFLNDLDAKDYLLSTDFYFTVDKYAELTAEKRIELEKNRAEARRVIRTALGEI